MPKPRSAARVSIAGQFEKNASSNFIEAVGFRRDDVRRILLTHIDFDHAGGLPDSPQAQVHVHAGEKEAALGRATMKASLGVYQLQLVRRAVAEMRGGGIAIIATDNDEAGERIARRIEEVIAGSFRTRRHRADGPFALIPPSGFDRPRPIAHSPSANLSRLGQGSAGTRPLVLEDDADRAKLAVEIAASTASDLVEYVRWVELSSSLTTAEATSKTVDFALRKIFQRDVLWQEHRRANSRRATPSAPPPKPSTMPGPSPSVSPSLPPPIGAAARAVKESST